MGIRVACCRVTLVVALVALAGCSGLFGAGPGSSPTPETDGVTPAPVPNATDAGTGPTPTRALPDAPPGVAADGTVDAERLRAAHRSVLETRSYTRRARLFRPGANRTVRYAVRAAADGTYVMRFEEPGLSVVYGDSTGRYTRIHDFAGGEPVLTGETTVSPTPGEPLTLGGLEYLALANASVTRVDRDGERLYRIHAAGGPNARVPSGSATAVTAYVRPDGLVRTVQVTRDLPTTGARTVTERWTWAAVGETTVTEPDWVRRLKRDPAARGTERFPPGLGSGGVENADRLRDAHRYALSRTSFTLVRSGAGSRSLLPATGTVAVANETTYLVRRAESGVAVGPGSGTEPGPPVVVYGDPTGRYRRAGGETGAGGEVAVLDPQSFLNGEFWHGGARWLGGAGSNVTRVERNGSTRFRVRVAEPPRSVDVDAENFTATAVVRPSGLIERLALDVRLQVVNVTDGGSSVAVEWIDATYRYEYRRVGNTTVAEPAWVTRAKRNRTSAPASV